MKQNIRTETVNSKPVVEVKNISWLVPLIVGAIITLLSRSVIEGMKNRYLIPVVKNNLSVEIIADQQYIKNQVSAIRGAINDVNHDTPYISAPPSGDLINDIFHSYLTQLNLLPDDLRTDILVYYVNVNRINYEEKYVEDVFSRYSLQKASKSNVLEGLNHLSNLSTSTFAFGESLLKKLANN